MKKMTDLLSETDDSISLMSYLKAMFPYEWSNFKERMKVRIARPPPTTRRMLSATFSSLALILAQPLPKTQPPGTRTCTCPLPFT